MVYLKKGREFFYSRTIQIETLWSYSLMVKNEKFSASARRNDIRKPPNKYQFTVYCIQNTFSKNLRISLKDLT